MMPSTLFRERTAITAELVAQLPRFKLISQRSVYPHIDVEACTNHGVLVCSNLHGSTRPMRRRNILWALIMAGMRDLPAQMSSLQQGQWQIGVGKTLHGRTLGLYGYGRIAKQVAIYAKAFGMKVVWWGQKMAAPAPKQMGRLSPAAATVFADPDVVSVHVRMKPETKGLITKEDLAALRQDALL